MANKTVQFFEESANESGNAQHATIAELLKELASLRPKTDTDVATLRKTLSLVSDPAARAAIEEEINSRAIGDDAEKEARAQEIVGELSELCDLKTRTHGWVKAGMKIAGDYKYRVANGKDADEDE